jgi:hypothetical protein
MGWFIHVFGLDSPSGTAYLAWSGILSDVGELALIGAVYGLLRKHNCHQQGCLRIGRHLVDGTPWCNKHHQKARAAA